MADYAIHDTTLEAIADTIRKKDGTLALIDPADYADRINLMGMLEEKTTTKSAIANITDGADRVTIKAWGVTLPASLTGYSSLTCSKVGKNWLNIANLQSGSASPGSITNNGDGTITVTTGTQQNVKALQTLGDLCPAIKVGEEYYLSAESTGTNKYIYLHALSLIWNFGAKKTITAEMLASDLSFYASGAGGTTATISNLMLRPSIDTDATFAPYVSPTVSTVSLGRTIYGGSVDVVNGTGTETCSGIVALNSLTWTKTTIGGHDCFFANLPNGYIGPEGIVGDCDSYDITTDGQMGTDETIRFYNSTSFNFSRVSIRDDQYASLTGAQFKEAVSGNIVYELAESARTDFTFTPISPTPETKLGTNNFFVDGDTQSQVTYRGQGTVTVYPNAEEASF